MKYIKYSLILLVFAMASCDLGSEPAIEGTKLQAMAGEWWVQLYAAGEDQGIGYHLVTTSNTAENNETDLIVDDHGLLEDYDYPPIKVISKVNLPGLTFNASTDLPNLNTGESAVSILEGKIIKGVATTPGGNKTDSIYVKFEFKEVPGEQYEYAGYRRTGFLEDEH
ncbi:lipid-binding protein [Dyadobacter sp. 22481]|uniref:lipid-binding protein n=1 Tax=Dyadobacter sp. 22481 TaxID=3453926 RepID=UPI003F8665B6